MPNFCLIAATVLPGNEIGKETRNFFPSKNLAALAVIANPETRGQCADTKLGEIWVASPHNAACYHSLLAEDANLHTDHFNARLVTGDTSRTFARTGYLGFLRRTQSIALDGGKKTSPGVRARTQGGCVALISQKCVFNLEFHDALFVVGSIDEAMMLRGNRYQPADIEATVQRSHKRLCEWSVLAGGCQPADDAQRTHILARVLCGQIFSSLSPKRTRPKARL